MLITKEVKVQVRGNNIKYYEELGYDIPRRKDSQGRYLVPNGSSLIVKVCDLPKGTSTSVEVECDYCKKHFYKKYSKYIKQKENSISSKDCCKECIKHKTKESMLIKYGCEYNTQIPEVREYISQNNKRKLSDEFVNNEFLSLGYIKITKYKNYKSPIEFICKKHEEYGTQTTNYATVHTHGNGCHYCRYEKISGENYYNWKGGISPLRDYLRYHILQWKEDTIKSCDYKCVITGERFDDVHHLYGYNKILDEALTNTNIILKPSMSEYSDEELNIISKEVIKLHYKYGLGVCLKHEIHELFHNVYGRGNNTKKQFLEFRKRYLCGEYNEKLEEVS